MTNAAMAGLALPEKLNFMAQAEKLDIKKTHTPSEPPYSPSPDEREKMIEYLLAQGHTPMMAQYHVLKSEHPDCLLFYRMGDFYEMFFDDAVIAAEVLNITLTKRGKAQGDDIAMCGVPHHSYESYLSKLIKAGHKVAMCEQMETPDAAKARMKAAGKSVSKALVTRDVVRIVTQGTLTEEHLLEARENNYLCSFSDVGGTIGVSWLELSTGAFFTQNTNKKSLRTLLERITPREILSSEGTLNKHKDSLPSFQYILSEQPESLFNTDSAHEHLKGLFQVDTVQSFGSFGDAEISSAGALIDYVLRTQKGKVPYISTPTKILPNSIMEIDAATQKNLELTRTLSGERKGSLLDIIDNTITGAASRMLHAQISAPLCNTQAISRRHDRVAFFINNSTLCDNIRDFLRNIPDMERALSRITVGRGSPKDLAAIRDSLAQTEIIRAELQHKQTSVNSIQSIIAALHFSPDISAHLDDLKAALEIVPPALTKDGGYIQSSYNEQLLQTREISKDSRSIIATLQADYKKITGVDTLKIKFNNVLGYFVEVPAKRADMMMSKTGDVAQHDGMFLHRQTTANAARFTTQKLSQLEQKIASSTERIIAIEQKIFDRLVKTTELLSVEIVTISRALSKIDISSSYAKMAIEKNHVRPVIDDSCAFDIKEGRHPVVESMLKKNNEAFVPNDCALLPSQRLWLITGPNMAGKSTFLRQNALISIMAQVGCYVPAQHAHIGVIDKCFSRVGASDDLARGQSTFMVEMVETAAILNQATPRSLVILDEIGRGTATYDGLSIAWSCVEHLHNTNKCRALFATHYHELTTLESTLKHLACYTVKVKEWKDSIIFMHKIIKGSADRSYGIHVAKLAGLPKTVTMRAESILAMLNTSKSEIKPNDLPLFSDTHKGTNQNTAPSEVETRLESINPDDLTPRESLELFYELKKLLRTK